MRHPGRQRWFVLGVAALSMLLGGCEIVVTTGPVELYARYDFFTVDRYVPVSVTLYGLTTSTDLGLFTLHASCVEEGYPGVATQLSGTTELYAGEVRTVTLWYDAGDPYLGYDTVWCSFDGETSSGREVIVGTY